MPTKPARMAAACLLARGCLLLSLTAKKKRLYWMAIPLRPSAWRAALRNRKGLGRYRVEWRAENSKTRADTKKRLIVCLTHEPPWPIQAGNQYRIARMIDWLSGKGYELLIFVVPMADEPLGDKRRQALFNKYDNVLLCYRHGLIQSSMKTLRLPLDRLDNQPIKQPPKRSNSIDDADNSFLHEYEIHNCHDALIGLAQEIARQVPDAIWYINYAFMSRVIEYLPGSVVTFVDTHDVFSQKPEKVFSHGIQGEIPITPDEERRMLLRPGAVLAIQGDDAVALRRLVPEQTILTVGIDFDSPALDPPPREPNILMVASDNPLNTKGLHEFLQFAWPSIKAEVRDVKLTLVGLIGRTAPAHDPQIAVAGTVEFLHPYYERARVVINPAIAGTGLKVKAVESISHRRPIVTWPAGVDGIHEPLLTLCHVVHDWREFADTIIKLLTPAVEVESSGANYAAIRTELGTQAVYRELETWLEQL